MYEKNESIKKTSPTHKNLKFITDVFIAWDKYDFVILSS